MYVKFHYLFCSVCVIKSVDDTSITAFFVHECEGSSRMGSRPRRYIFTGHADGSIQVYARSKFTLYLTIDIFSGFKRV